MLLYKLVDIHPEGHYKGPLMRYLLWLMLIRTLLSSGYGTAHHLVFEAATLDLFYLLTRSYLYVYVSDWLIYKFNLQSYYYMYDNTLCRVLCSNNAAPGFYMWPNFGKPTIYTQVK